ncbi:hypothetical protein HNO89_001420 [Sporosarcina luteola]|nr:hypothetical protein [Sporosarcina luteola]
MNKDEQIKKWIEDRLQEKVVGWTCATDSFFNEVFIEDMDSGRAVG